MNRLKGVAILYILVAGLTACGGGAVSVIGSGQPEAVDALAQADATAAAYAEAAAHATQTVEAAYVDATAAAEAASAGQSAAGASAVSASSMPVISSFDCDPCAVGPSGTARLSWQVSNAEGVFLDGMGVVAPGEKTVSPDQTTTYRLSAVNSAGRSEKAVTVSVPDLPTIHFFSCLPCDIRAGEQALLSWDLSGGTAVYLDGEGVPAPGTLIVAPLKTTTYRLEALSAQGSVTRLLTVTVLEAGSEDAVHEALVGLGYQVTALTELSFENGDQTRAVIMQAGDAQIFNSRSSAAQVFQGFQVLSDNFKQPLLSVGLYDGDRYIRIVTQRWETLERYHRGDIDGVTFWRSARYDTWDEWSGRWLLPTESRFLQVDFSEKSF
jgi:hypothetical protein